MMVTFKAEVNKLFSCWIDPEVDNPQQVPEAVFVISIVKANLGDRVELWT